MIHSMTGFGSAEFEVDGIAFGVEVRSVNHRHLDVRLRLPRNLAAAEAPLRALVTGRLARGKVDASIAYVGSGAALERVEVDLDAAAAYVAAAQRLSDRHALQAGLRVGDLLALPGVARTVEREFPEHDVRAALSEAVERALDALAEMRAVEGANLERELRQRLDRCEGFVEQVDTRAQQVQRSARERLRKRAEQLRDEIGGFDETRLHQELVFAADRLDITEETVRLHSHIDQFRLLLDGAQPGQSVGRRLEFLLQEMGREANTVGSKGSDAPVAHLVVELKSEIERLREQVQNVE